MCWKETKAPNLIDNLLFVSTIMQEYMQERRDAAAERVQWLLELEAHVFTLNKHYLQDYREKFLKLYRSQRQNAVGRTVLAEPWNPNQFALEIMATVRAYFQGVSPDFPHYGAL